MSIKEKMKRRRSKIDKYKIVGFHPVTNEPIDIKWHRGASRWNNGATVYNNKYIFRLLIGRNKENQKLLSLTRK
jgi:hypothetical protein